MGLTDSLFDPFIGPLLRAPRVRAIGKSTMRKALFCACLLVPFTGMAQEENAAPAAASDEAPAAPAAEPAVEGAPEPAKAAPEAAAASEQSYDVKVRDQHQESLVRWQTYILFRKLKCQER